MPQTTEPGCGSSTRRASTTETRREFGPGALGIGWELGLGGLGLHLADPAAPIAGARLRRPFRAYLAEFMTASSDRWAEASVAAGTDPEAARAAAERCIAAYTTQPEPTPEDI